MSMEIVYALPPIRHLKPDDIIDRFCEEEGCFLDGSRDETNANWLCPGADSTVEEALKEYASIKAAIAAQDPDRQIYHAEKYSKISFPEFRLEGRRIYVSAITMIRVPPDTVIEEEKKAELKMLCEENSVRIISEKNKWTFQDLLFNRFYALEMVEYPGSADDAATYGSVCLR